MRLPIRNYTEKPLTLFIEVMCDQYEIPPGGEALVTLSDGYPHSIDVYDGWVTVWNENIGEDEEVEISPTMRSLSVKDINAKSVQVDDRKA